MSHITQLAVNGSAADIVKRDRSWIENRPRTLVRVLLLLFAPLAAVAQQPSAGALPPPSVASISGTVRDAHGVVLGGVHVMLVGQENSIKRAVDADPNGVFTFAALPAGTYRVNVNIPGLEPFTSPPIVLSASEQNQMPTTDLRVGTKTTIVSVNATLAEVAEAQVKQEETQRIIGILPNYYTSYIWNAAPMTTKLKYRMALRTVTDPATFLFTAGVAGVEQAHKTFPGYGQEFEGYAKRYGGSYADAVTGRFLSSAIFPSLLHQDPRYFYQGSGTTRSRLLYAIVSSVICRGDNGELQPNYSHMLGSFTAAGLSNLYRSPQDRRASLTIRNGFIILAGGAAVNVMREFLSRKLTGNVPAFANGKP